MPNFTISNLCLNVLIAALSILKWLHKSIRQYLVESIWFVSPNLSLLLNAIKPKVAIY